MLYTGNKIVTTYEPLIEASKELKFEVTQAHLWFEEIISGVSNEQISSVWQHLDLADWYALAMLEGGEKDDYKIIPLMDEGLREEVIHVRETLAKFRHIAEHRYTMLASMSVKDIDIFLHKKISIDLVRQEKIVHLFPSGE